MILVNTHTPIGDSQILIIREILLSINVSKFDTQMLKGVRIFYYCLGSLSQKKSDYKNNTNHYPVRRCKIEG